MDSYDLRARVLPALLVAAPALALGLVLPFGLHGAHRLWSLLGFAVLPLAAALMRRLGNAAQSQLWSSWGGAPATQRLRWTSNNRTVTSALHAEVRIVLGGRVPLPTAAAEGKDPAAADAIYNDVVRRLFGLTRNDGRFDLLHRENANYGFTRNLYGARRLGIVVSTASLLAACGVGAALHHLALGTSVAPLLLPVLVAVAALIAWWRLVTPALVRAPANALADRLFEALQTLAAEQGKP